MDLPDTCLFSSKSIPSLIADDYVSLLAAKQSFLKCLFGDLLSPYH